MHLSLKAPDGTVIESYKKDHREFIRIAGKEYEVFTLVDEFDSDHDIRRMIEASEKDIEQDRVFSTEQMIEAIERGEL